MIVEEVKTSFECVRCKGRVTNTVYMSKDLEEHIKSLSRTCSHCYPIYERMRIVHLTAKRATSIKVDIEYHGSCSVCGAGWTALVSIPGRELREALSSDDLGGRAKCLQCGNTDVNILHVSIVE